MSHDTSLPRIIKATTLEKKDAQLVDRQRSKSPGMKNEIDQSKQATLGDLFDKFRNPSPKVGKSEQYEDIKTELKTELATCCKRGKDGFVNVKVFVQKDKDSMGHLKFGRDKTRKDELRVEWDPNEWVEWRFDEPAVELNEKDDILAYPKPGQLPEWEQKAGTFVKKSEPMIIEDEGNEA